MSSTQTEINKQIIAKMYNSAMQGDFAGLLACLDESIIVHEPPFVPYGGVYKGHAGFQQAAAALAQFGDLSTVKVEYLVGDGERVFAALQFLDRKTGKPLHLVEESVVRNGKIVEMKVFYYDAGSLIETGLKTGG